MNCTKFLSATTLAAMLATVTAPAQAQIATDPELVDLPTYLAYVAQHPTRPFEFAVLAPIQNYVEGEISPYNPQSGNPVNFYVFDRADIGGRRPAAEVYNWVYASPDGNGRNHERGVYAAGRGVPVSVDIWDWRDGYSYTDTYYQYGEGEEEQTSTTYTTLGEWHERGAHVEVDNVGYVRDEYNTFENDSYRDGEHYSHNEETEKRIDADVKSVGAVHYRMRKVDGSWDGPPPNEGHLWVNRGSQTFVEARHTPGDLRDIENQPLWLDVLAPVDVGLGLDVSNGTPTVFITPPPVAQRFRYGQGELLVATNGPNVLVLGTYGREFIGGAQLENGVARAGMYQAKIGVALAEIDPTDIRADLFVPGGSHFAADVFNAGGAGLVVLESRSPAGNVTIPLLEGAPASPSSTINYLKGLAP